MQRPFAILALAAVIATAAVAFYGYQRNAEANGAGGAGHSIQALEAITAGGSGRASDWKALGRAYRQAGRRDDAVRAYVRAARLAPRDREIITALQDLSAAR